MLAASPSLARTPLYHWHRSQGAQFLEKDGWNIPGTYRTVEEEVRGVSLGIGLVDISSSAKIGAMGRGVSDLASTLLGEKQARRRLSASLLGGNDRVAACRLMDDHMLFLGSGPRRDPIENLLTPLAHIEQVLRSDVTSALSGISMVGEKVNEILRQCTSFNTDIAAFPVGSCAETNLLGAHALLVRTGETVVPSLRIYVAWDLGQYLWETLMEVGRRHGIFPMGWNAWEKLTTPPV